MPEGRVSSGRAGTSWTRERRPIGRSWSLCNSLNPTSGCGLFISTAEEQVGVGVSRRPGVPVDQDPGSTLSPPVGSSVTEGRC